MRPDIAIGFVLFREPKWVMFQFGNKSSLGGGGGLTLCWDSQVRTIVIVKSFLVLVYLTFGDLFYPSVHFPTLF